MNTIKSLLVTGALLISLSMPVSAQPQEKVNRTRVELKVGQEYKIELQSAPAEGFSWSIVNNHDTTLIQLLSQVFEPGKDTTLPGKPGKDIFLFKALKKGEVTVRLAYKKKYDRKIPRVEDYLFVIGKQ
ncbi:MAG TPA: protease inhibitor I42 family protein [Bacteroidales bacterium]|nr:protease inhibitor I42 family protein [Bacteroidales bacterium]HSA44273.1 protease inhibitor I42 family protein [Bacteroidales bacterium]